MRVLLLLVMVGNAFGQSEVRGPKDPPAESGKAAVKKAGPAPRKSSPVPARPPGRVRWVTDPVTRFSEQNRARRRAIAVKPAVPPVQKVGVGPNAAGWDPWAPPDFNQPYEKKWPEGKGFGYCCQITVVGLGGGGAGNGLTPLPGGGGGGVGSPAAPSGGSAGAGLSPGIPSAAASNPFSY